MIYEHIPVVWARAHPDRPGAFFAAMEWHAGRRVFVHCAANYRASAFIMLYRVLRLGLAGRGCAARPAMPSGIRPSTRNGRRSSRPRWPVKRARPEGERLTSIDIRHLASRQGKTGDTQRAKVVYYAQQPSTARAHSQRSRGGTNVQSRTRRLTCWRKAAPTVSSLHSCCYPCCCPSPSCPPRPPRLPGKTNLTAR